MKIVLLALFLACCTAATAQSAKDSSAIARMQQTGLYLDKFVTQHNTGLAILMAGGVFGMLAPVLFPVQTDIHGYDTNLNSRNILIGVAAAGGTAGAIITLDSYKQLRRAARQLKR